MKKIVLLFVAICSVLTASAQTSESQEKGFFKHLDASLTMGTTGLGLDVASPMGEYAQLRAGFSFMPHIHYTMSFGVQVGDDPAKSESKFQKLSGYLKQVTGYDVDNSIDMIGVPTFYNFNLLVDIFPFKNNKHWHFTAGFYWGNSQIGKAYNMTEDMTSLMAVGIYNTIYDKIKNGDPLYEDESRQIYTDNPLIEQAILRYGRMGIAVGTYTHDIYGVFPRTEYDDEGNKLHEAGEYGVIHHKGDPYMMEPGQDGMAKAWVTANSFKPYVGFGYGGRLIKGNDKLKVSFDCGLMFWGGTPSIVTHDGTDLANDVENIKGKVGDYVDLIKGVKAFPVLNVRFTHTIF